MRDIRSSLRNERCRCVKVCVMVFVWENSKTMMESSICASPKLVKPNI
jgi:hypothetical protein